jgi:hypothetical protein
MENRLLGLFRLISSEERTEIVDELATSLWDLYDAIEDVRYCAQDLDTSINRICYGDGQVERNIRMVMR